jgi:hypothetical protein
MATVVRNKFYAMNLFRLIFLLVLLKVIVILISDNNQDSGSSFTFSGSLSNSFNVNPDELSIAIVAFNYNKGLGYVSDKDYSQGKLRRTAWRPTFPVWLHIIGQRLYRKIYPESSIEFYQTHPYFQYYGFFLQVIYVLLYGLSLYYFYQISYLVIQDRVYSKISLILFTFIPSVFYYIGTMPCYENIALSCLIIVIGIYCKIIANTDLNRKLSIVIICLSATLACLLRPQLLAVMLVLLSFLISMSVFVMLKKQDQKINKLLLIIALTNGLFLFCSHLPILLKNHSIFNAYFLSTQDGYEFLQGHNPLARGAWNGLWYKGTEYDNYVRANIPQLDELNEYEESKARRKLAAEWIQQNPFKEITLIARKTAMYFLPNNFLYYSDVNLSLFLTAALFLGFITGFLLFLYQLLHGFVDKDELLLTIIILMPVLASWLISVIFFVEQRVRYYAEPFMLIIAIKYLFLQFKKHKS